MSDIDPRALEAHAREAWTQSLARLDDAWVEAARQELRDAGMVFGGRDAVTVARPMMIAEQTVADDNRVVGALIAALSAAADLVLADDDVAQACMPDWLDGGTLDRLMRLDPGYRTPVVFGRFDGTRQDGRLRILEFNGGIPGGVLPTDGSSAVMATWPAADALREHVEVRYADVAGELVDAVVEVWHEYGGEGLPRVVVAVPGELADLARGGIAHLVDAAGRRGVRLESVEPGDCVHVDGRLRVGGEPVDVLVRAFFTFMLPTLGDRAAGIISALEAGEVCMVTSFRSGLLGHKALFALVTDPDVDLGLDAHTRAVATAALPWTRLMRPGSTTDPHGASVDLLDFVQGHRESLVLKPGEGYGGHGVVLGWEVDGSAWAAAIQEATSSVGWIVQERLAMLDTRFAMLEPGFPVREFTGDVNPIVAAGRVAGYFVRLAHGGMTNLTSGGASTTGTLIVSPRP